MSNDVVGVWDVPLSDGLHTVEFEHGTASGKRIVKVDGKVSTNMSCNPTVYFVDDTFVAPNIR